MNTKNSKKTTTLEIPSLIAILTPNGIRQEIARFRGIDRSGLEDSNFRTDSALLKNWIDQRETSNDLESKLISGLRKAAAVFDEIHVAAEDFTYSTCQAKPYNDRLTALRAERDSLSSRLEHLTDRDCRKEMEDYEELTNELQRLRDLMERGSWRTGSLDHREELLKEKLVQLSACGQYCGEVSQDGVFTRCDELNEKIARLDDRAQYQLTDSEAAELLDLSKKLMNLDEVILEEERYSNHIRHQASYAASRYNRILDAAEIRLMGLHQIHDLESFRCVG